MTEEQVKAFLAELTELSLKHHIVVDGHGCPDAPWMIEWLEEDGPGHYETDDYFHPFELKWIKDTDHCSTCLHPRHPGRVCDVVDEYGDPCCCDHDAITEEPPELADEPLEDWTPAEICWHEGVEK